MFPEDRNSNIVPADKINDFIDAHRFPMLGGLHSALENETFRYALKNFAKEKFGTENIEVIDVGSKAIFIKAPNGKYEQGELGYRITPDFLYDYRKRLPFPLVVQHTKEFKLATIDSEQQHRPQVTLLAEEVPYLPEAATEKELKKLVHTAEKYGVSMSEHLEDARVMVHNGKRYPLFVDGDSHHFIKPHHLENADDFFENHPNFKVPKNINGLGPWYAKDGDKLVPVQELFFKEHGLSFPEDHQWVTKAPEWTQANIDPYMEKMGLLGERQK